MLAATQLHVSSGAIGFSWLYRNLLYLSKRPVTTTLKASNFMYNAKKTTLFHKLLLNESTKRKSLSSYPPTKQFFKWVCTSAFLSTWRRINQPIAAKVNNSRLKRTKLSFIQNNVVERAAIIFFEKTTIQLKMKKFNRQKRFINSLRNRSDYTPHNNKEYDKRELMEERKLDPLSLKFLNLSFLLGQMAKGHRHKIFEKKQFAGL